MDKLLIVDGSNLLFQMFYGMPSRILSPGGVPIQGTLGFVGALLKVIRMVGPTHVAVFFDGECENARSALDESYKANREDYSQMPEEDTPFSQLPHIFAALEVLGIRWAETTDCEADDWMAGYALSHGDAMQVVICSQDSDLFQLIGDNVHILRYRGEKTVLCDRDFLRRKLGIEAEQYADHKALTGDHSDNIPGLPGIGPKTATALLRQFGTLEKVLSGAQEITKPSVRATVTRYADRARLNYRLIRLENRYPLPFPKEVLAWQDPGMTTSAVLREIGLR